MAGPDDPDPELPTGAAAVWQRLGNTTNFVEPFELGFFEVLLTRPAAHRWWERFESVNDPRGGIVNLFRALAADAQRRLGRRGGATGVGAGCGHAALTATSNGARSPQAAGDEAAGQVDGVRDLAVAQDPSSSAEKAAKWAGSRLAAVRRS